MNKYRFKTEEEFIIEFGGNWRNIVRFHWISPYMDNYFGKILNLDISDEFKYTGCNHVIYEETGFNFSWDMIKNISPNYKPRQFTKEI